MKYFQGERQWLVAALIGCLIFSGTLFFANLGKRDLWNPDEPRYTQIARDMVLTGSYLVPHLNQHVYTQKTPLFFWMVAGSFKAFHRINEWTARFPVALSAVLCVLFTFLIGRRLFDPWAGFFSALLLSTTSEFFWLANRVNFDTVMTLFILISIYALVRALTEETHKNLWFRLAFIFSGVATVTKGPLGLIVPFLTLVVYLLVMRDFRALKKVPWLSGGGLFLLIILVGLGPTCLAGGKAYTNELVFRQTLTRYVHGINHRSGILFYLWVYPETLLPWALFLPAAILFAVKKRVDQKAWPSFLFIFVWIGANILFISFSGSKRQLYILSLLPAGSILLGFYFSALFRGLSKPTPWFKIPVYILGVMSVVMGIVLPFAPYGIRMRFPDLVLSRSPFILMGILGIIAGLIVCILNGKNRIRTILGVMIVTFYVIFFVGVGWIFPLFNQVKSPRALGNKIQALIDEGYDVRTFGGLEHAGILFYTRKTYIPTVSSPQEVEPFFKGSPKPAVLMIKRQLKDFIRIAHVPLKVMCECRVGHRIFVILQPVWAS